MNIPTYAEAMAFAEEEKVWTNKDGSTKQWKINWRLCKLAREFHGNYNWKGTDDFRHMVRKETKQWKGHFWGRSLHNLGENYEEIFSFFTEAMNSSELFKFPEIRHSNLIRFWVEKFREQLKYLGEDKLAKKYDNELAMAYYWVVANTVQGILDEYETFVEMKKHFSNNKKIKIEWASDEDDYRDVDIYIMKDGKIWHYVSVKNNGAFSVGTILKYRKEQKETKPTMYCDKFLNRIFFRKGTLEPYYLEVVEERESINGFRREWGEVLNK